MGKCQFNFGDDVTVILNQSDQEYLEQFDWSITLLAPEAQVRHGRSSRENLTENHPGTGNLSRKCHFKKFGHKNCRFLTVYLDIVVEHD